MSRALWSKTTKNPDASTGPLARLFACLLGLLILLLAPHCSLRSCTLLRSLTPELVGKWMSQNEVVLSHSASVEEATPFLPLLHRRRALCPRETLLGESAGGLCKGFSR